MTKKKDIGTEEVLYRLGLAAALTAAAVCMFLRMAPPEVREWLERYSFCVIYRLTGFTCPGCGGTRALEELLEGHVARSFLYHPLAPCGLGFYAVFMGSHTWEKLQKRFRPGAGRPVGIKWKDGYAIAAVGLLVGNFIIKNLIHLFTKMDVLAELDCLFMGQGYPIMP